MANAAYVFFAGSLIAFAIMVHLLWRYDLPWISRNLQPPDLRALQEIAEGKRFGVGRNRLTRLASRGFAVDDKRGGCRITLKGRYASFRLRVRGVKSHDQDPSDLLST